MEQNFWLNRWETNQIGFHLSETHPFLVKHFDHLALKNNDRVFLPLCGKTLDIHWLLAQGYQVVGAELVEMAIIQLFEELNVKPKVETSGKLKKYSAPHIDIFVGDIFDLERKDLGHIDATYDRAALVALPEDMRTKYVDHLRIISSCRNELLITFEYDQSLFSGPPFSVVEKEVKIHYPSAHLLDSKSVEGGIRGQYPAKECVWYISGTNT